MCATMQLTLIKMQKELSMIVDKNSGEIIGGKFMKLFYDDIEKLFSLTGSERALLYLMMKSIGMGNRNSIIMNVKRKKEYANKINLKTYRSVTNMLKNMELKNIIKRLVPDDNPNEWTVNPELIFSGNEYQQVKMILTYTNDGRKLEVITGTK